MSQTESSFISCISGTNINMTTIPLFSPAVSLCFVFVFVFGFVFVFVFGFAFLVCICKRSRGIVVTESGCFFLHVLVIDEHLKHVKEGGWPRWVYTYTPLTFMVIQCSDILYHIYRTTTGQEGTEYQHINSSCNITHFTNHFIEPQRCVNMYGCMHYKSSLALRVLHRVYDKD